MCARVGYPGGCAPAQERDILAGMQERDILTGVQLRDNLAGVQLRDILAGVQVCADMEINPGSSSPLSTQT